MKQWEDYYQLMAKRLSKKRLEHSLRVVESGLELGRRYGGDLEKIKLAGLLHDGAKELSDQELLEISEANGLITDPAERLNPSILHGPVAAWLAKNQWEVSDPVVLEAIRYHTTAAPQISLEALIVFMADLIEPGRFYQGVDVLRALAKQDLKKAVLESIDQTFIYLARIKAPVHQGMVACRNWLEKTELKTK